MKTHSPSSESPLLKLSHFSDSSTEQVTTSLTKYIRIRSEPDAKFVIFDFAIGDPSLFVELVLPPKAFEQFCQNNHVVPMTQAQMDKNDAEEDKWRYGFDATLVGNNHDHLVQDKI